MGRYSTKFLFCFKISPNFLYVGDAFRVKLTGLRSDYINASHFNYNNMKFILTQGPIPQTIESFWAMIYQQKVSVIVKLVVCTDVPEVYHL